MSLHAESKFLLREKIRSTLKQTPAAERELCSARICSLLLEQTIWKKAQSILFFAPLPEEPDIWPLISPALVKGKLVALPSFVFEKGHYTAREITNFEGDVRLGQFNIREPREHCSVIALNRLDLILVPGVAFDLDGRRLGRGKGFYDRLLAEVRGVTCGIAFDEQIVEKIPVEPHDVKLNCILTPTRWRTLAMPRAVLE